MKLTRRQLALVSTATLASAQTEPRAANPANEIETARERLKANGELLARQTAPMDTEPAFQFKA